MTDPLTASVKAVHLEYATLAFQNTIKGSVGELAKKFRGEAIAKIESVRKLIWNLLMGKHLAADKALEQAKAR